ncbi:MAG: hypothetical protein ACTHMS_22245 [Jatrophihabitans sp.]|uniref:hypothetical protein n=1 Tax=Jatrophihabitans sp. TaxID=1932789 RepID=UPI003F800AAE
MRVRALVVGLLTVIVGLLGVPSAAATGGSTLLRCPPHDPSSCSAPSTNNSLPVHVDLSGYATFESFCVTVQFARNLLDPGEAFVFVLGGYEGVGAQNSGTRPERSVTACSSYSEFMDALSTRQGDFTMWMNSGSARVTSISVSINGLPPTKVY